VQGHNGQRWQITSLFPQLPEIGELQGMMWHRQTSAPINTNPLPLTNLKKGHFPIFPGRNREPPPRVVNVQVLGTKGPGSHFCAMGETPGKTGEKTRNPFRVAAKKRRPGGFSKKGAPKFWGKKRFWETPKLGNAPGGKTTLFGEGGRQKQAFLLQRGRTRGGPHPRSFPPERVLWVPSKTPPLKREEPF